MSSYAMSSYVRSSSPNATMDLMLMENPEEFRDVLDRDVRDVLDSIQFNQDGLVPAIVQDVATQAVLMMAWMNRATLELTLREGRTVFWSRSRQKVWRKGDTSGERQWLRAAYYDCDADALLFVVKQDGEGACHLKKYSCFHMPFSFHSVDSSFSAFERFLRKMFLPLELFLTKMFPCNRMKSMSFSFLYDRDRLPRYYR